MKKLFCAAALLAVGAIALPSQAETTKANFNPQGVKTTFTKIPNGENCKINISIRSSKAALELRVLRLIANGENKDGGAHIWKSPATVKVRNVRNVYVPKDGTWQYSATLKNAGRPGSACDSVDGKAVFRGTFEGKPVFGRNFNRSTNF